MTTHVQRRYGQGDLHFITFTGYRRLPLLRTARARNAFVEVLAQVRERYGFALVGYVVMPEHVHLLIGEPARGTPSTVIQVLKQRVSRRLRGRKPRSAAQLALSFGAGESRLRRFWQRRFFDFNVWSLKKRIEKLDYMHMNPLKRKLVGSPRDWPWSSFSSYANAKGALIPIDPVR